METRPGGSIYFVTFCGKTTFLKLQDIFPECFIHREQSPQVEPMICIRENTCPVNHNCMETLAKRIYVLFGEVLLTSKMIVLYYRKRNVPGLGGCVFWRDMREPRTITINPYAWNRIKQRGNVYIFNPAPTFFLTGRTASPETTDDKSALVALD